MTMIDPNAAAGRLDLTARFGAPEADERRLNEAEMYSLLSDHGLTPCGHAVLPEAVDEDGRGSWAAAAAELAAPMGRLVLKVLGRDILHKSDVGGVRVVDVDPATAAVDLPAAADDLLAELRRRDPSAVAEGVLACAFVPHKANQPGQELLLSTRLDGAFGPVVVVGVGGILTEWFGEAAGGASKLIFPARGLVKADVASTLSAHPMLKILTTPSRLYAEPPISADALADAVLKLAGLAVSGAEGDVGDWTLAEVEINPAVVAGGDLIALDGVGLLKRRDALAPPRPLAKIENLLEPRSALIMGASAKGPNPGRIIMNNLRRSPGIVDGKLYVVHPRNDQIDGVPCLPDVAAVPEKVDMAVVCIPASGAGEAIGALVAQDKAESIILIPGGFAEAGHGDLATGIVADLERSHGEPGGGPVMVGANCLGIVSRDQYNTFFLPEYKLPFSEAGPGRNLALVSQSGAYLVTFASNYDGVINPRASISYGNQMDLTAADFLAHFIDRPEVTVIACYVEGFKPGDGERFVELAAVARERGKQVLIFKAGKTPLGAKAAASHTASLAGDYDVARACLEHAGVQVCATLGEFEDLIKIFTLLDGRGDGGRRVGIMSNAGFECSAVTDALGCLEPAAFDGETRAVLDANLPPFAHRDNPIDATPMAGTEAYANSIAAMMADPGVDCAILSSVPVTPALDNLPAAEGVHREDLSGPGSQASRYLEILADVEKPLVVVIDSGAIYDPMAVMIERAGLPVYRKIDRAARALSTYVAARHR